MARAKALPPSIIQARLAEFDRQLDKERRARDAPRTETAGAREISSPGAQPRLVDAPAPAISPPPGAQTPAKRKVGRPRKHSPGAPETEWRDANRGRAHLRPDKELLRQFKTFCAANDLDLTEFFELAGARFIESVGAREINNPGAGAPLDDRRKTIWKTSPPIVNLYLQYLPDNRWKPRDDREAEKYNGADLRCVEAGMLAALIRTEHRRIHSFKYFAEEIEEMLAVPLADETLDVLLARRRDLWRRKGEGK